MAIDDVIDKKLAALEALESQFYEGGAQRRPAAGPGPGERRRGGRPQEGGARRRSTSGSPPRPSGSGLQLAEWYGAEQGEKVKYAEAFEICEYGRMPPTEELKKLFPFKE